MLGGIVRRILGKPPKIKPEVTIYKSNVIAINSACMRKYKLEGYRYVRLYDLGRKIGIKFLRYATEGEKSEYPSYKMSFGHSAVTISGTTFLRRSKREAAYIRRYTPKWDRTSKMLTFESTFTSW